jgi:hypothetical protein
VELGRQSFLLLLAWYPHLRWCCRPLVPQIEQMQSYMTRIGSFLERAEAALSKLSLLPTMLETTHSSHPHDKFGVAFGCVRFQNQEEWNGMVPFLGGILVFGSVAEWNGMVPRKGIFFRDAEYTHPSKSAGRGRTRWNGDYANQV